MRLLFQVNCRKLYCVKTWRNNFQSQHGYYVNSRCNTPCSLCSRWPQDTSLLYFCLFQSCWFFFRSLGRIDFICFVSPAHLLFRHVSVMSRIWHCFRWINCALLWWASLGRYKMALFDRINSVLICFSKSGLCQFGQFDFYSPINRKPEYWPWSTRLFCLYAVSCLWWSAFFTAINRSTTE